MDGESKRIVVMVAMEEEALYLRPLLGKDGAPHREHDLRGVVGNKCTRYSLDGTDIDVVISGIGGVHASSATTAALLSGGPCAAVLSVGCAGAHRFGQKMGDLVLGSSVVNLDAKVIARDGSVSYAGVRYSMTEKGQACWEADPKLLALAQAAADEVRASAAPDMHIDVGVVGSADAWRQAPSVINEVHTATGSLCEEMEAHAIAQVCAIFGVPFLAIKDIANSELAPDEIQLEPSHHVVPETVKVGYHAALVGAEVVRKLCAATAAEREERADGASSSSSARKRPAATLAQTPPSSSRATRARARDLIEIR